MPLTPREAREELITLRELSDTEVRALFDSMMGASDIDLRDMLMEELPALGEEFHLSAASLAADWYDDMRDAAEVRGTFSAVTADLPTPERWESLVRWGLGPMFQAQADREAAITLISGGIQKATVDASRRTISFSAAVDPRATGWARYGNGDSCKFCRMLISRGEVYTAATAKFGAHDNCNCIAGPVFDGAEKVNGYVAKKPPAAENEADRRTADAARAKAWITENIE